ncbi:hypothetical protein ACFOZY_04060 [Chungangia koreensis]|uniref:Uncharacterized protein n=1 Tax=Chungangia koreensis TaxID=752657 RepID=A0ABV8X238_9LACT
MIGILLTKTQIERPIGDIGHPNTLPFPAVFETASREEELLPLARNLKSRGAKTLITEHLTDPQKFHELSIPTFTSPLILLPTLIPSIPGKIAIFSDKEASITPKLLETYHVPPNFPLIPSGMDDMPAFTEAYVFGTRPIDVEAINFELTFVTQRIRKANPDLGAIILMSPYMSAFRKAIQEAADVPIYDIVSLVKFVHDSYS